MARPRRGEEKQKPRPLLTIDWEEVDSALRAQCDGDEIADSINVCAQTLYERCVQDKGVLWLEYKRRVQNEGKQLLRKKQLEVALSGNSSLLVHLGEHILGQTKNSKVQVDGVVTINRVSWQPETSQLPDDSDPTPTFTPQVPT